MTKILNSEADMRQWATEIGTRLKGGECLELVGDVGAGKTTFVKGLAKGLGITDDVQSPSFTISRVYAARDNLQLDHYDFYRLPDAGVMEYEFAESAQDDRTVTIIEWAGIIKDILPEKRITLTITTVDEQTRQVVASGDQTMLEELIP